MWSRPYVSGIDVQNVVPNFLHARRERFTGELSRSTTTLSIWKATKGLHASSVQKMKPELLQHCSTENHVVNVYSLIEIMGKTEIRNINLTTYLSEKQTFKCYQKNLTEPLKSLASSPSMWDKNGYHPDIMELEGIYRLRRTTLQMISFTICGGIKTYPLFQEVPDI